MKDDEKIREILLNWFKSGTDPHEEALVHDLFCDNTMKEKIQRHLYPQFFEIMGSKDLPDKNLDHILHRIHYNINSTRRPKRRSMVLPWLIGAAATIILPVLLFFAVKGFVNYSNTDNAVAEIHSPAWMRTRFTLPDGSTGWLNSSSSLKYSLNFSKDRHLELKGEGYFDVVPDKSRPFVVSAGDVDIKVHGTKFNVTAWDDDKDIEVVLDEGTVELIDADNENSLLMVPNQIAIFNKQDRIFTTETVETKKYLSWTEGKLVFRNDPMAVVVKKLERWYGISIDFEGFVHDDFRLRATFVDESLEEVLSILKKSVGIEYKIDNRSIISDETYEKKRVTISVRNQ